MTFLLFSPGTGSHFVTLAVLELAGLRFREINVLSPTAENKDVCHHAWLTPFLLIFVLCLSHFSTAVTKHHSQGSLQKELVGDSEFQRSVIIVVGQQVG